LLSPLVANSIASSKVSQPQSQKQSPWKKPPPIEEPLTRLKSLWERTRTTETPEPILQTI